MSGRFSDVYETITAQILADLERGVRPWTPSWQTPAALPRRSNGEPYRGVNVLLLWMAAARQRYQSPHWLTFRQALALGANVRKGEKATRILFFDRLVKDDTREGHEGESRTIAFAKTYAVFNADQVDNLPERFRAVPEDTTGMPGAEFFAAVGAMTQYGPRPMYRPSLDCIEMPRPSDFATPEAYVSTHAHELVHWTGHRSRLERDFSAKGTDAYAVEELVAEIGSALLCATLGVAATEREDHAAYIAAYVKILRDDRRLFARAAAAAQRAVDFLHERAAARQTEFAA